MTLYASVLELDRSAVKALRITDAYSLHRVVFSLFDDVRDQADKVSGASSGILFADRGGGFRGRQILLLADRPPAESVNGKYGTVRTKPIPESFLEHQHYRFKVIVNPTRRDRASGKLVPVKGREAIAAWFGERATKSWGFSASSAHLQVDKVEVLRFTGKHQNTITLAQAHLQGRLEVQDPARFTTCFRQGIGRGRAFGCGLLQLVPITPSPFE